MSFGYENQPVEIPYVKMKGTVIGTPTEYPKWKFHPTDAPTGIVVEDAEDEASLGEGWHDSPAAFGKETAPQQVRGERMKRGPGRPRKAQPE